MDLALQCSTTPPEAGMGQASSYRILSLPSRASQKDNLWCLSADRLSILNLPRNSTDRGSTSCLAKARLA